MFRNNKSSTEAIKEKNEELESYFANTIIPQLFVDVDLILRRFTPPAMIHFNLSGEDIGKDFNAVKDNFKYPTIIPDIQVVIGTGEILEKEIETGDGRWYQLNILPFRARPEDSIKGVILTFVEITRRVRALRDLEMLNVEHDTMMYALSHDIKQPLTTLSLLENLLEHAFNRQDPVLFKKTVLKLRGSIIGVRAVVDSFVAANDPESKWERKREWINIPTVVDDITTALKSENFTIENFQTDFKAYEIFFSRNNFRSIVYNLLNNAVLYSQPGVELKVRISTARQEGFVLLQVRDNGIGIAEEDQEKIFDKGSRLNSNLEGTGMGLFIIKRMLESSGSRISVESKPGEGSIFSVYFKE